MTDTVKILSLAKATMCRCREYSGLAENLPCGLVAVDVSGSYSHGWEFAAPGVFYEFRGGYRLRPKCLRNWRLDVRTTSQRRNGRNPSGEFMPLSWCKNHQEGLLVIEDFIRGNDPECA